MKKILEKISNLKHEKELTVYQIFDGYRVCEDNGEVAVKDDAENYVDLPAKVSVSERRQLKAMITRKNKELELPKIVAKKTCSCGKYFEIVPILDAMQDKTGWWWTCHCTSTLFFPYIEPKE